MTEFPKLVETYRRFQNHPFELITISVDSPDDQDQVENFLQDQHVALARRTERLLKSSGRTTNNLLFVGDDLEASQRPWTRVDWRATIHAARSRRTAKYSFGRLEQLISTRFKPRS